jgi:sugar O-acyltransferase (sialic acid O-acetyltransferase NeuD family)
MSKRPIIVFGTGDFARTAEVYLREDSEFEVVGFTVDAAYIDGERLAGLPVVPFETLGEDHPPSEFAMFVAVGFSRLNKTRAETCSRCIEKGYELISYVSSKAMHWGELSVGRNCFIFEGNVIQPNVRIGDDVIIWSGNHVGHDAQIGDHCFIASHAVISGNLEIGPYSFVGVNATIRDGITIAPECIIGAGAIVMRDTRRGDVFSVRGTELAPKRSWEVEL